MNVAITNDVHMNAMSTPRNKCNLATNLE